MILFLLGKSDWQQLPPSGAVLCSFGILIRESVSWGWGVTSLSLTTWGLTTEAGLLITGVLTTLGLSTFIFLSTLQALQPLVPLSVGIQNPKAEQYGFLESSVQSASTRHEP